MLPYFALVLYVPIWLWTERHFVYFSNEIVSCPSGMNGREMYFICTLLRLVLDKVWVSKKRLETGKNADPKKGNDR